MKDVVIKCVNSIKKQKKLLLKIMIFSKRIPQNAFIPAHFNLSCMVKIGEEYIRQLLQEYFMCNVKMSFF